MKMSKGDLVLLGALIAQIITTIGYWKMGPRR
jgi:uncharacterized membrane protein